MLARMNTLRLLCGIPNRSGRRRVGPIGTRAFRARTRCAPSRGAAAGRPSCASRGGGTFSRRTQGTGRRARVERHARTNPSVSEPEAGAGQVRRRHVLFACMGVNLGVTDERWGDARRVDVAGRRRRRGGSYAFSRNVFSSEKDRRDRNEREWSWSYRAGEPRDQELRLGEDHGRLRRRGGARGRGSGAGEPAGRR